MFSEVERPCFTSAGQVGSDFAGLARLPCAFSNCGTVPGQPGLRSRVIVRVVCCICAQWLCASLALQGRCWALVLPHCDAVPGSPYCRRGVAWRAAKAGTVEWGSLCHSAFKGLSSVCTVLRFIQQFGGATLSHQYQHHIGALSSWSHQQPERATCRRYARDSRLIFHNQSVFAQVGE